MEHKLRFIHLCSDGRTFYPFCPYKFGTNHRAFISFS